MGRIFISAGHGGLESGRTDPGAIVAGTTEAQEMIELRDLIVPELRSRNFETLFVPDDLSLVQSIDWINARSRLGDVAIEIHADAFSNTTVRGASAFYIANNDDRRSHAELMLIALIRRVPQLPNRGAKPDTAAGVGSLAFCRNVMLPSILLEVGFLTNAEDRSLLQTRRRDFALGIADGLAAWSNQITGSVPPQEEPQSITYPSIGIRLNDQPYPEGGVLVNNNSYVPIDLVDNLGIDSSQITDARRIDYRGVVYIKAVDLRNYNVSVQWDNESRSVLLKTIVRLCVGQMDRIMGHGYTSDVQLMVFLKGNNAEALGQFTDIAKLYREEAAIEGVNHDIAFCQMCLETNFLRFGGDVKANQNNFAGLGAIGGGVAGANFPSIRLGIRAQVQHLKAYASTEPILQEIIDPRFRFVRRGTAPLVSQLSGRWAADLQYGDKIMSILRRLYESAQ
ncbi:MAG: N-acetylmuramoyl-L-alanine amidase, partial [Prochlorotrichaceae cyanobacterium]